MNSIARSSPMRGIPPVFRLVLLVAVAALVTGGTACKTGASAQPDTAGGRQPAVVAVPDDFRMVFGQGGGFTGQWTGYTIRADGTVLSWSGQLAEEGEKPAGSLSGAQVGEIWNRIQQAGFFEADIRETGNMTAFIRLTAGERTNRVSWVPGVEGFEAPRSPIDALYRYSLRVAGQAEEQ